MCFLERILFGWPAHRLFRKKNSLSLPLLDLRDRYGVSQQTNSILRWLSRWMKLFQAQLLIWLSLSGICVSIYWQSAKMYFSTSSGQLWLQRTHKVIIIMGSLPLARHVKFPCRNVQISARKKGIMITMQKRNNEKLKTIYSLSKWQFTCYDGRLGCTNGSLHRQTTKKDYSKERTGKFPFYFYEL